MQIGFSYTRFSDGPQALGRSRKRQDAGAERWAIDNGIVLDESLNLHDEGLSGYWGANVMKGALGRFLALCGTPRVPVGSVLIIEDFDRLSRELPDDAWELFRRILLAGVDIAVLSMGRFFRQESLNSFEDRIVVQASQHRAHQESAVKSRRLLDVWESRRQRAREGKSSHTVLPTWIVRDQSGALTIPPGNEATIREMVRLSMGGMGIDRISQTLTQDPARWPCFLRIGRWDGTGVYNILSNEALFGGYYPRKTLKGRTYQRTGELILGHYPAILTRAEYDSLRARMTSRTRQGGRKAIDDRSVLRGLAYDAETGDRLRMRSSGCGKSWDYLDRDWEGGRQLLCPYPVALNFVLRAVQQWTPSLLGNDQGDDSDDRARAIEQQLLDIQVRQSHCREEMGKKGRSAAALTALADAMDQLAHEQEELTERLGTVRSAGSAVLATVLGEAQSLAGQYASADASDLPCIRQHLRQRLTELLDGLWIYRQFLGHRKGAVYLQLWPRAGQCQYTVAVIGKPPAGWKPLALENVDLRNGYPAAFSETTPKRRRNKRA